MPNKSGSRSGKSTPPQAPYAVGLDAVAEQCRATPALGLEGRLERVNGRENHTEAGGAKGGKDGLDG